jgi:hypothetical protein
MILHWLVRRKGFAFSIYHTTAAVLFKVFLGCLYGYIFLHYYGGDDTWDYFNESIADTDTLLKNPLRFIQEFLPSFSLKITHDQGWNALVFYIVHFEKWFMVKSLAVLNLFSGKNYYIDLLWFDLLTITGSFLLYKMLVNRFPARAGMYYVLVFFIPSITFWCSGIRAEALIFFFIALILYNGKAYAQRPNGKNAAGTLLGMTGFLLFRMQFLAVFLPAFLAYMLSVRNKRSGPVYFNRVYLFGLLIFIASLFLPPSYSLSGPFIHAQQAFFQLHGNTRYKLDSLQSGPVSFLKILPQAVANSSFRPYPWEGKGLLQSLSSIENIFLFAGFLFFVLSYRKKQMIPDPLLWLFLYYGISQLIAIGYTVPFPGAIVRYRCIPFLFIFIFLFSENDLLQQKLTKILF